MKRGHKERINNQKKKSRPRIPRSCARPVALPGEATLYHSDGRYMSTSGTGNYVEVANERLPPLDVW